MAGSRHSNNVPRWDLWYFLSLSLLLATAFLWAALTPGWLSPLGVTLTSSLLTCPAEWELIFLFPQKRRMLTSLAKSGSCARCWANWQSQGDGVLWLARPVSGIYSWNQGWNHSHPNHIAITQGGYLPGGKLRHWHQKKGHWMLERHQSLSVTYILCLRVSTCDLGWMLNSKIPSL